MKFQLLYSSTNALLLKFNKSPLVNFIEFKLSFLACLFPLIPVQVKTLLESIEFVMVPVVNPDGYKVSLINT